MKIRVEKLEIEVSKETAEVIERVLTFDSREDSEAERDRKQHIMGLVATLIPIFMEFLKGSVKVDPVAPQAVSPEEAERQQVEAAAAAMAPEPEPGYAYPGDEA